MGVMDIAAEQGAPVQQAQDAAQEVQDTGSVALEEVTTAEKTDLIFWMLVIQTFTLILILARL